MIIESRKAQYEIGTLVAETKLYRAYLCNQVGSEKPLMLQVSIDVEGNRNLDYSAFILNKLKVSAAEVEAEYAKVKENPDKLLNYHLSFPAVVDSFLLKEQGNRRVNILEFKDVADLRDLIPLSGLVRKDKLRVDVQTSVWIMGKLLKTIAFAHDAGIVVSNLSPSNILIEPNLHYVIIFDWAQAQLTNGDRVTQTVAREETKKAANSVIEVLGGTAKTGIPNDGSPEHVRYTEHLMQLARAGASKVFTAHTEFYNLVDNIWPRGFHPFTTLPLEAALPHRR